MNIIEVNSLTFSKKEKSNLIKFFKTISKKYILSYSKFGITKEGFVGFIYKKYDFTCDLNLFNLMAEVFSLLHRNKKNNFKSLDFWFDIRLRKICIRIEFKKKNKILKNY